MFSITRKIHLYRKAKVLLSGLSFFCIGLFSFTYHAEAVSLEFTQYYYGEPVNTYNSTYNFFSVYETGTGQFIGGDSGVGANTDLTVNTIPGIPVGAYSVIESLTGDCFYDLPPESRLTYEACKAQPDFVEEFLFGIIERPGSNMDNSDPASQRRKIYPVPPTINFLRPVKGTVYPLMGTIEYEARDINDQGTERERYESGILENSVSLYYTDKIAEWDYSTIDPAIKTKIVEKVPVIGSYPFSTERLTPGKLYRIIANALDMGGLFGENVSEPFLVDLTKPHFSVSTFPTAVKSGQVQIFVDSSEEIRSAPQVTVTQRNGQPVSVQMSGNTAHFEGSYTVIPGYDGTASIKVSGTDLAGNIGTTTVSGGTFSVGTNPPPSPTIKSPANNSVTGSETIDVVGNSRNDTKVFLVVNGIKKLDTVPDEDGNFIFKAVQLNTKENQGINTLSVFAEDAVGTQGPSNSVSVKKNVPPLIRIVKPVQNETIGNQTTIDTLSSDENGDTLLFTYEVSPVGLTTIWTSISDAAPGGSLVWNSSEVDDGEYNLRVLADDGTTKATSTTVRVLVKNTLPFIRFENGRKTVTNKKTTTIVARALTSTKLPSRPNISTVEYSLDGGQEWATVKFDNDGFAVERKFSVEFKDLKEGAQPILWRVKDARGFIGKATHTIVVDSLPPKAPIITSPQIGGVLSQKFDEDTKTPGLQVTITGTAEPLTSVTLSGNGAVLTTKTLPTGKFVFPRVLLQKTGNFLFELRATDAAQNKSVASNVSLRYNNAPIVAILEPRPLRGLSGTTTVSWNVEDIDGDLIRDVSLSYRRGNGEFVVLGKNLESKGTLVWDTSSLPQGKNYELRLDATDGVVPTSVSEDISVDRKKPEAPTFTLSKDFTNGVLGTGTGTDESGGVEYIEYGILESKVGFESPIDWFTARIMNGFLREKASYEIRVPRSLRDGEYRIFVRSVDAAKNISDVTQATFSIDRTAPRIGSAFFDIRGIRITPDEKSEISVPEKQELMFGISLEDDTKDASLFSNGVTSTLSKNLKSGLWEAFILPNTGSTTLEIIARDMFENKTATTTIATLHSIPIGGIRDAEGGEIKGATIRVLKFNEETNEFTELDNLRSKSDENGSYTLALSQGTHKLVVQHAGFRAEKKEVTIDTPRFITDNFTLVQTKGFGEWLKSVIDWIQN